jgi:hypothetical protein
LCHPEPARPPAEYGIDDNKLSHMTKEYMIKLLWNKKIDVIVHHKLNLLNIDITHIRGTRKGFSHDFLARNQFFHQTIICMKSCNVKLLQKNNQFPQQANE